MEIANATTLNLLTREGIVTCRFESQLHAEQYEALFEFVRRAETRRELEGHLVRFAEKWGTVVAIS
jgi:hypothetical protein